MQFWVQEMIRKELAALWKSIGDLEQDCPQIALLKKKAIDLAEQQDHLMRMVEELSTQLEEEQTTNEHQGSPTKDKEPPSLIL